MIIDARKAGEIKIVPEDISEIVDFYQAYQDKVNGTRVAILAGTFFGKAKLYEKNVQPLGMNVIVFANFDTACLWLNLDRRMVTECNKRLQGEA